MLKRNIAGILLVLSFTFVMLETILRLFVDGILEESKSGNDLSFFSQLAVICYVTLAVFSIFALVGAISAFTGKKFYIAITGAACGIFTIGWCLMGTVCGFAALIVLYFSKNEFEGEQQPQRDPYGKDGYPLGAMPSTTTNHQPPVLNLHQDEPIEEQIIVVDED